MPPYAAFHLGLHCLPKYGIQNEMGYYYFGSVLSFCMVWLYRKIVKINNLQFVVIVTQLILSFVHNLILSKYHEAAKVHRS